MPERQQPRHIGMKASSSRTSSGWTHRPFVAGRWEWTRFQVSLAAVLFAGLALARSAEDTSLPKPDGLSFSLQGEAGRLDLNYKGKRLLQYAFATNQFKPYVRELYTLQGENILLDSPADHVHHHGLMYAVRVNGINFWEEAANPGVQKPVGLPVAELVSAADPRRARISQTIHWVARQDRWLTNTAPAALLIERRDLTLTVNETYDEVALAWYAQFEVGPAVPKVTLSGAPYHGLGLRLPRNWDHVAKHKNAAGLPYSAEQKGDVTTALWSVIENTIAGRPVSVAMFARRANAGKARFFTMLDAFAYVSATQDLENVPLEYTSGQRFNLDYLVLVYSTHRTREFLQQRYEQ
jgi:hypothetical protein